MERKSMMVMMVLMMTVILSSYSPSSFFVSGSSVSVWETLLDESSLLKQLPSLNTQGGAPPNNPPATVTINTKQYQEIYGFGGTLTESSAINLIKIKNINAGLYHEVLNQLFNSSYGAGFTMVRIPVGSSDFSITPWFTYDNVTYDELFKDWAWQRDAQYILPVLKDILSVNRDIKIVLSPWSPPIWMKTSNDWGSGTLRSDMFDDYAYYLQITIQKYNGLGIDIYAITPQNEPLNEPAGYPAMRFSAQDEASFVKSLGPKLKSNNIATKIIVFDHNWQWPEYPTTVLSDATASSFIAGSAFHCYGGQVQAQSQVYNAYPDKEIWFTECSGTGPSNFNGNIPWNTNNLYIGSINNWSRTVLHWNFVLDWNNGPYSGTCTNCRGIVTVQNGYNSVSYNEEFYGMAMFSKFLKYPAHRLDCSLQGGWGCMSTLCFSNGDGSTVVVVANFCQTPQVTAVQKNGQYVSLNVGVGLTSFVWPSA
eukprot:TRINITY_DN2990_c0_g1_i4.p1 TRINITY_DN2990_c0_g1~~TRINITY_DN2990_c0_g1_i4.p1  ORF type:complete len:479 (+),score=80.88 TRINITY_DN2990_c0_g1_i4:28-1464(+)